MNRGRVVKHRWATALSFSAVLSPVAGFAAWLAGPLPAPATEVPFTETVLSTATNPRHVYAADLDGDGDIDVLSASVSANAALAWHESDGGCPPTFTEHEIADIAFQPIAIIATDVDLDGDTDVITASLDNEFVWYDSSGGFPPTFAEREISGAVNSDLAVFAVDLDGDGDSELLTAGDTFSASKISLYVNLVPHTGDLDGDGDVDLQDYALFQQVFLGPF